MKDLAIKETVSPSEGFDLVNTCRTQRTNTDLETPMEVESPEFRVQVSNFENEGQIKVLTVKPYQFHENSTIQEQFTEELLQASYAAP